MIERKRLLSLGYYKKAASFTGSDGNKNYKIQKTSIEGAPDESGNPVSETKLMATIWPGPLCFDKTDDDKKKSQLADFTEDGLLSLVEWMNSTTV